MPQMPQTYERALTDVAGAFDEIPRYREEFYANLRKIFNEKRFKNVLRSITGNEGFITYGINRNLGDNMAEYEEQVYDHYVKYTKIQVLRNIFNIRDQLINMAKTLDFDSDAASRQACQTAIQEVKDASQPDDDDFSDDELANKIIALKNIIFNKHDIEIIPQNTEHPEELMGALQALNNFPDPPGHDWLVNRSVFLTIENLPANFQLTKQHAILNSLKIIYSIAPHENQELLVKVNEMITQATTFIKEDITKGLADGNHQQRTDRQTIQRVDKFLTDEIYNSKIAKIKADAVVKSARENKDKSTGLQITCGRLLYALYTLNNDGINSQAKLIELDVIPFLSDDIKDELKKVGILKANNTLSHVPYDAIELKKKVLDLNKKFSATYFDHMKKFVQDKVYNIKKRIQAKSFIGADLEQLERELERELEPYEQAQKIFEINTTPRVCHLQLRELLHGSDTYEYDDARKAIFCEYDIDDLRTKITAKLAKDVFSTDEERDAYSVANEILNNTDNDNLSIREIVTILKDALSDCSDLVRKEVLNTILGVFGDGEQDAKINLINMMKNKRFNEIIEKLDDEEHPLKKLAEACREPAGEDRIKAINLVLEDGKNKNFFAAHFKIYDMAKEYLSEPKAIKDNSIFISVHDYRYEKEEPSMGLKVMGLSQKNLNDIIEKIFKFDDNNEGKLDSKHEEIADLKRAVGATMVGGARVFNKDDPGEFTLVLVKNGNKLSYEKWKDINNVWTKLPLTDNEHEQVLNELTIGIAKFSEDKDKVFNSNPGVDLRVKFSDNEKDRKRIKECSTKGIVEHTGNKYDVVDAIPIPPTDSPRMPGMQQSNQQRRAPQQRPATRRGLPPPPAVSRPPAVPPMGRPPG